jgi:hypothetical protein
MIYLLEEFGNVVLHRSGSVEAGRVTGREKEHITGLLHVWGRA